MHKALQLFILLLLPLKLFAQIDWAHHIGSALSDNVEHHTIDHEGNIIAVGYFGGTVTFGNQSFTSTGDSDIFIYKASLKGNVIWAKTFSSPSHTGDVGVDVDKSGNIFIAGGFIEQLRFDDKTILNGNERWNSFICKLDTSGKLIWVKGILGTSSVSESRVYGVVDANDTGDVVVAANFSGVVTLEGNTFTANGSGGNNLVIAKFSPDGKLDWYNTPETATNTEVRGIALTNNGQVYFTGSYTSTLTLGANTLSVSTYGYGEIFLSRLDDKGIPVWAKSFNKIESRNLNNAGKGIAFDEQAQEVYILGNFKGKIALDAIQISADNTTEETGNGDMFLAKLTADGAIIWGKRIGTSGHDFALGLSISHDGLLIVSGALDFRPSMQVYDKNGIYMSGHSLNTGGWVSNTTYISSSEYYMSGVFFGGFQEEYFTWNSKGTYDGFLLKVGKCQGESTLPVKPVLSNDCSSISFIGYTGFGAIEWYKNDIKIEYASGEELLNPETGYYKVSIRNNCGISFSDELYFNKEVNLPPLPEIIQINCKTLEIQNPDNYNITWYNAGFFIPAQQGTVLPFTQGGVYTVRFTNECGYRESFITVNSPNSIEGYTFYNVITPNGDNKNEHFQVDPALLSSTLQVYNRWGKKVYESKKYQNDWNGAGLTSGVYYWTINNECVGIVKGTITIIR